ncbi:hypothetical protein SSAG_02636 [Streptomyces sp. Mg1]|nr:hypothetical protein SSAG_02636 [Streptomyces sp. Mg1]
MLWCAQAGRSDWGRPLGKKLTGSDAWAFHVWSLVKQLSVWRPSCGTYVSCDVAKAWIAEAPS